MAKEEQLRAEDLKKVQAAVDTLGEHFDTVQILVSIHRPGELDGTSTTQLGTGNWFARYGQMRVWILKEDQAHRNEVKD